MKRYLEIDTGELKRRNCYRTAREICQQPRLWRQAYAQIDASRHLIDIWLAPILATPNLRILLCGAGTSAYIGDTVAAWLRKAWNTVSAAQVTAVSTTELTADPAQYLSHNVPTLMISFARSGDSPESLASVELADQQLAYCRHLILTCNPEGRLARLAGTHKGALCLLMPEDANDRGFAMTSSHTTMLVSALAIFTPDRAQLEQAGVLAQKILDDGSATIAAVASLDFDRLVVLGAGCLEGIAREAALKCLELTAGKVVALHETPLGFRHGPKIFIDESTVLVHLRSNDEHTKLYDRDLLRELETDGRSAAIVDLNPMTLAGDIGAAGSAAELNDAWLSVVYVVHCQLLAFHRAMALGIEADNPCPSGEVNRVVDGVTIYPFRGRGQVATGEES